MVAQQRFSVGDVSLTVKTWRPDDGLHRPVVLLPATAETADDWDHVAATLSSSRTVHVVNLRGHGPSDWPGTYSLQLIAEDVAALLPQLSDQPLDLVAHSLGGLVACQVAATRPDLVARLVLEDVGLLRPRRPSAPARPDGELDFDWALVEQVRPEIDDPDPHWARTAAAITARTLVIAGGPRSTMPQEHVADLADTIPDAHVVTMDTGHLVHATQPDAFSDAVQAFLDSEDRVSRPSSCDGSDLA